MFSKKVLIIGGALGAGLLVLIIFFIVKGIGGGNPPLASALQFWGVYDPSSSYVDVISKYEKSNPSVKINYREFAYEDYERSLINAFASGTGPDIWLMHNTWLPKHGDKISPMPTVLPDTNQLLMTINDFKNQFVDVAYTDLTYNNSIYALPIYIDTLALFYNKDLFNSAAIASPPADWENFNSDVKALTKIDKKGHLTLSGAALGTVKNINRSTDILMLLMMQSGVQMTDTDNTSATFAEYSGEQNVGETALQYYTDFANPAKEVFSWDDQQHYSVNAFAEGKTAMTLNYSHQIKNLHAIAPRFNFAVAPVPQFKTGGIAVNFANYWAPTVSKQSKAALEAWKFLVYLSSSAGATDYLNASGRPAARRDLIQIQQNEPDLGVFAKQALSARSWYQVDNTAIETIFADMIEAVNYGRTSIRNAIQSAESKVNVLMQKNR